MNRDRAVVRFWGVRGSIPTPGVSTVKYGGNTACVEIQLGSTRIILDAGTGLRELGRTLVTEDHVEVSLLLSHYHWDHLLGLPFFAPLFNPKTRLDVYGEAKDQGGPREALQRQFSPPHFPVDFGLLPSQLNFHPVTDGDSFKIGACNVKVGRLNHPQGAVSYRVEAGEGSVVYASDHEHDGHGDEGLIEFARGATVLIYDAMFTDESYAAKKGWGHSTWQEAVRVARAAEVQRLLIFHHDPIHDDKTMASIERAVKKAFRGGEVAREGLELEL